MESIVSSIGLSSLQRRLTSNCRLLLRRREEKGIYKLTGKPLKNVRFLSDIQNKITGLRLSNFKSFCGEHTIPIAPITLIFGANSTGKSSIVQALALMREMILTENADVRYTELGRDEIDLGGFQQFRSKFAKMMTNTELHITYQDRINDENLTSYGIVLGENRLKDNEWARGIKYSINNVVLATKNIYFDSQKSEYLVHETSKLNPFSYILEVQDCIFPNPDKDKKLAIAHEWLRSQHYGLSYLNYGRNSALSGFEATEITKEHDADSHQDYFVPMVEGSSTLREKIREFILIECNDYILENDISEDDLVCDIVSILQYDIPRILNEVFKRSYADYKELLESLRYLAPFRRVPSRSFVDRFSHLDSRSGPSGLSSYAAIRDGKKVRERVNYWLDEKLFLKKYEFRSMETVPIGVEITEKRKELRFYEVNSHSRFEVSLQDVGSGLSQVIPVIVFCLANSMKTLLVEQPELHLHPSGAAEMGDLLIDSALGDTKNTVIAETHSEHLVLRILKRVRQTAEGVIPDDLPPIRPEDVSILFVQPSEDGKGSEIISVPITEDGDVQFGWPDGFMPKRLSEFI